MDVGNASVISDDRDALSPCFPLCHLLVGRGLGGAGDKRKDCGDDELSHAEHLSLSKEIDLRGFQRKSDPTNHILDPAVTVFRVQAVV